MVYLKPLTGGKEYKIGSSAIVINGLWGELTRMMGMVRENVDGSFDTPVSYTHLDVYKRQPQWRNSHRKC